jgi:GGDEF domain-containing protein
LKENNIEINTGRFDEKFKLKICEEYLNGNTIRGLSKKYNIDRRSIQHILLRAKVNIKGSKLLNNVPIDIQEKIRDDLIKPFFIHDHYLKIGASVGIAIYPDHGLDEEALVSNADKAMYFAKTHGRNKIQFFDSKLLNPS